MTLSPREKMKRLISNHRSAMISIEIDFAENYRQIMDLIEAEEMRKINATPENKLRGLCTPSRTDEAGSQGDNQND